MMKVWSATSVPSVIVILDVPKGVKSHTTRLCLVHLHTLIHPSCYIIFVATYITLNGIMVNTLHETSK